MHTTPIQIRFNDVDQMGHVNNAVIMEYLDLGKDAFFSGHGLSPTKSDFTVMVVHYDVDFKGPYPGGDRDRETRQQEPDHDAARCQYRNQRRLCRVSHRHGWLPPQYHQLRSDSPRGTRVAHPITVKTTAI